jgi:hypothetical protein
MKKGATVRKGRKNNQPDKSGDMRNPPLLKTSRMESWQEANHRDR